MRNVGKIAVLAMTLALAFVLTACGGSSSSGSASASTSASSASAASTAAGDFAIGTVDGNKYTNKFLAIEYALPEGFSFYNDAQLAEMNTAIGTIIDEKTVLEALESGNAFFDMVAATENGTNINVVVQYAGTPEAAAIDAAGYLEASKDAISDQLKDSGITVKSAETGTYENKATGDEFAAMKLALEMQGVPMYEEVLCLKTGDYFATITATSENEAELDSILANLTQIR